MPRELRAATSAARGPAGRRGAGEDLRKRVSAAAQHAALLPQLAEARAAQTSAVDEAQQLTEAWLRLREQRLEGMAAEMAVTLVVGGGCPVCGSEHHPHPARGRAGAPDAEAERQARKAVDDAEAARHAHDEHVRDLTTRIAMAELLSGSDRTRLAERVAEADAELARVRALADDRAPIAATLRDLEAQADEVTRRRDAARLEHQGVVAAETAQRVRARRHRRRGPGRACGTPRTPTWPPAPTRLARLATACHQALAARERADQARAEAARSRAGHDRRAGRVRLRRRRRGPGARLDARRASPGSPSDVREHEAARLAARKVFDDLDAGRGRRQRRPGPRLARLGRRQRAGPRPPRRAPRRR